MFDAQENSQHYVTVSVATNNSDTVQFAISVDLQGEYFILTHHQKWQKIGHSPKSYQKTISMIEKWLLVC